MGMFDFIKCKYSLPDIDLSGTELTKDLLQNGNYQTKDLDLILTNYTIEEDGQISWTRYKKQEWIENQSIFGGFMEYSDPETIYWSDKRVTSIIFYDFFQFEETPNDYWVEWQALISDSKVTEIKLFSIEKQDNTQRKQNAIEREEKFKSFREKSEKWYHKYILKYLFTFRRVCKSKLVKILESIIRTVYKYM